MRTHVFNILGGLTGADGWVTSRGMIDLADRLTGLPGTFVTSYSWDQWYRYEREIRALSTDRCVVIGYSGGGWKASVLAANGTIRMDLLVMYDPSPARLIGTVSNSVRNAVCYHNTNPRMWWPGIGALGGGALKTVEPFAGRKLQIDINQWHLAVQYNAMLHAATVAGVEALNMGADPIEAVMRHWGGYGAASARSV